MLRKQVIEILDYPRNLAADQLAAEDCDHGLHYAPDREECRDCWQGLLCEWLHHHDDCVDLDSRSLEQLVESLETALGQVDAHLTDRGHDRRSCRCDTCSWHRRAQRVYRDSLAALGL